VLRVAPPLEHRWPPSGRHGASLASVVACGWGSLAARATKASTTCRPAPVDCRGGLSDRRSGEPLLVILCSLVARGPTGRDLGDVRQTAAAPGEDRILRAGFSQQDSRYHMEIAHRCFSQTRCSRRRQNGGAPGASEETLREAFRATISAAAHTIPDTSVSDAPARKLPAKTELSGTSSTGGGPGVSDLET
jgi:hypothetical protein